jgi:hypothetical protein
MNKNEEDDEEKIKTLKEEYDDYIENVEYFNLYGNQIPLNATLTPKDGYDNILIFLGGISDISNKYFDFFKSNQLLFLKEQKYILYQDAIYD